MKLFQRLLIAPATLGLLAPMTVANATDFNFKDVSNYSSNEEVRGIKNFSNIMPTDWTYKALSDLASVRGCSSVISKDGISRFEAAAILNSCLGNVAQLTEIEASLINEFQPELATLKGRVDGLESRMKEFEAGGFSETTTASFAADFLIGSLDGSGSETTQAAYGYEVGLNTSFTGEDSLDVTLKAGNAGGTELGEADLNDQGDTLTVDGISYTFPVGEKLTLMVGDSIDGSSLYNTACVYGGFTDTLDDCGNASSAFETTDDASVGLSASYDLGNGYTAAFGYAGDGSNSEGALSKAGRDMIGGQIAYTGEQYGLSVTAALIESSTKTSTASEEYLADTNYIAFNGYWTPADTGIVPSLSYGYESGDLEGVGENGTSQWFVGFQWDEAGNGVIGAAIGSNGAITEGTDDLTMYELFYSYPINDGMTITPAVFVKETAKGVEDTTGVMVKTSFEF